MQGFGRVDDAVFDVLREHLSDEEILEFTYITMMYTMHAVISVALRLEYDDRADPIVEIAAPDDYVPSNLGREIAYDDDATRAEVVSTTADAVGAAHAYAQVRAAIVENRYPPGQRLVEQRIAEELGLSRTPVREALRMLEAEGLVVSERNRGAMVRPLSPTEVVDLYGLRIRLESYAVEVATERATEAELGELVAAADAFGDVRRDGRRRFRVDGVRRLHDANRRFHDGVLAAARHHRLAVMLARTVDTPLVFQAFTHVRCRRDRALRHVPPPHRRSRCAAATRAGPRRLMAEHIAQGRDAVLDAMACREAGKPAMSATDTEHRRLCHALLDAIEQGDIAAVEACYAPEMTMWFNVTGQESSRDDNLTALAAGKGLHRRRTVQRPHINTFDDGFVVQYTCNVVAHNGARVALSACLVAEVHDGKIVKLFEYLDSGKFGARR